MGQILYGTATITHVIREKIQNSEREYSPTSRGTTSIPRPSISASSEKSSKTLSYGRRSGQRVIRRKVSAIS